MKNIGLIIRNIAKTIGWTLLAIVQMLALLVAIMKISDYYSIEFKSISNPVFSSASLLLILKLFIFPILEETAYRLLRPKSDKRVFIISAMSLVVLTLLVFSGYGYFNFIFLVPLLVSSFCYLKIIELKSEKLMVLLYTTFFALSHNFNFSQITNLPIHLLYFISIFIMGYIFSIVRIRYGFAYCILAHVFLNSWRDISFFLGNLLMA